jgi:hypothetical protein
VHGIAEQHMVHAFMQQFRHTNASIRSMLLSKSLASFQSHDGWLQAIPTLINLILARQPAQRE